MFSHDEIFKIRQAITRVWFRHLFKRFSFFISLDKNFKIFLSYTQNDHYTMLEKNCTINALKTVPTSINKIKVTDGTSQHTVKDNIEIQQW